MKKKTLLFVVISAFICSVVTGCRYEKNQKSPEPVKYESLMKNWKGKVEETSLTCWYTEASDKDWLNQMAKLFQKEYGIEVNLVYYDGVSMFEDINQGNKNGTAPDVYLCGNDQLELARGSGLALQNECFDDTFWKENYPAVARDAVTFNSHQYGFPVYFDTYCLVYDGNLLEDAPASMDDILTFADAYSDTGSTKAILRWDVADPYINTMFIASYANIFGEQGDDASMLQVYNDDTVAAMEYFHSLSEYMWMDKNNISHDIVKDRIQDGTLVLGLCKSDILPVLDAQKTESKGEEGADYKVSFVPSLTDKLSSQIYSTTYIAMVNPYGSDEDLGNMFACFLSLGHPELQYKANGNLPVVNLEEEYNENQSVLYAQYLNSRPVPKVMMFGDFMSESAIAYDAIWEGKDVNEQLQMLQNKMDDKVKN